MLTPHFKLSQTSELVNIELYLPYIKVSKSEIDVDSHDFRFSLSPYYLHLTFESNHSNRILHDAIAIFIDLLIPETQFIC